MAVPSVTSAIARRTTGAPWSMTSTRPVGIEEELMLVDPETGELHGVAAEALRAHTEQPDPDGPPVEPELFIQQIETQTPPCTCLTDLEQEVRRSRRAVGETAVAAGAAVVAVGTPVLGGEAIEVTPDARYRRILEGYGELTRETLVCGMHVHVQVEDEEEGVRVIDGIAPWLPVLLALSANSPYFRGRDTGHASWRDQLWRRLPSRGTGEPFGTTATYGDVSDRLVQWGAALDEQMIYVDTRLSPSFPTVELRIADVCLEVENGLLVAGLARALVTTYADRPPLAGWRSDLLRAATWRASRDGIGGSLVDPRTLELAAPRDVISGLVEECRDALEAEGDLDLIESLVERLFAGGGNGATQQRRVFEATGDLTAVVHDLRERTERSWR